MGRYNYVIAYVFILGLGMVSLVLFFYLHYTPEIKEYINKVDASNTTMGFRLTIIYGFAKLISFTLGISIPVAVLFKSIKEGRKKNCRPNWFSCKWRAEKNGKSRKNR
ncbi:hypothetical protein SAMN00777080_2837 [Aquiflexum balticum DSM 16537]|uniref:Uncharacterized protein n=1 Tax=Aquiflexum balticum DSM 16537 TaxID=758820 RepID=A0A1W2H5I3_9BACT|nr:hypothetical protein [Aquiflexum balticum]SMD44217.1 hypothetical protein SAMN00777080_2837 [Aquiflexum balticum DSM 16537]